MVANIMNKYYAPQVGCIDNEKETFWEHIHHSSSDIVSTQI